MFTLNYKQQFAEKVDRLEKRQTIRAERKDKRRPKVGESLRHYTGLRTKQCRKLLDTVCTEVLTIRISLVDGVTLGGVRLNLGQISDLARLDGFKNGAEFFDFFCSDDDSLFEGFLIRW